MLLGIDVGGTFTDAVVLRQGEVVAQAKRATTHDDVLHCVLAALDAVLQPGMAQELERVVISSTIVTNALTEGSLAAGVFGNYRRTGHERQGTSAGDAVLSVGLCGPSRQDYG